MMQKKKIGIIVGVLLFGSAVAVYAAPPRVSWIPPELKPVSTAPGQSASYTLTLKHTGIVPVYFTNQLRIVAEGDIVPFVTIVQPTFPSPFRRGDSVSVEVKVTVPTTTPLSVKTGQLVLNRVSNRRVTEVWRADALPVELTFSSFPIPPAPNKAVDEATILGVDSSGNGVPDRIDRWIAFEAPTSEKKRAAMTLSAKAQQDFFKDYLAHLGEDPELDSVRTRVRAMADVRSKTDNCRRYVFGAITLDAQGDAAMLAVGKNIKELDVLFMDTPERFDAFWASEKPLVASGAPNVQPEQYKQQCLDLGFNPDILPN